MSTAKTVDLVVAAKEAGYAVPAVNIVDDLSLRAVVAAAEEAQSPVIIQTSVKTVKSIGAPLLSSIFSFAAESVSVPVALHLDHCPDRAFITVAVENGWSSVLFDASDRPLEQAWQETKEVVAEVHAKGVGVECEIENIVGVEDGVGSDEPGHAYSSEQLKGKWEPVKMFDDVTAAVKATVAEHMQQLGSAGAAKTAVLA